MAPAHGVGVDRGAGRSWSAAGRQLVGSWSKKALDNARARG